MFTLPKTPRAAVSLIACAALAACASVQPVPYAGVESSARLRANAQDDAKHIPYGYSSGTDLREYSVFNLDPVVIYRGADNQFDKDITEEDKATLASYMESTFKEGLTKLESERVGPNMRALRIRLILTGVEKNTPVLSTLFHFDPIGSAYNGVQGIRGKEGALTGSVSFAVEIYATSTNELLAAYVSKQYPSAFNVVASVGGLHASKTGIEKGADDLVAYLKKP
ncbi:DUF3313 domain-containing protein [Burkholderia stagnalis]|uniref:DUF3313 domain-containing protein n=1 Tax=Burkholderia stagnalis TaxID=1503054 RepID=UPI0007556C23|nr:DUF3313 domain-containing protein [Burkholderia stagnalis]KVM82007.1 hypothetical protein WT05_21670 [Burkholderia stagnalis]